MLVPFVAAKLRQYADPSTRQHGISAIPPLAQAVGPDSPQRADHRVGPATWAIVAAAAFAIALAALLIQASFRIGLHQSIRMSWWFS
ncbi:hypothetical protein [Burkholderia sp. TSV86]|uniref:hypothetical protein n=1 Tax=Burkholderia sp. TSV86 TaxID=1385594 RepID=UPI0007538E47|nr:hypothetical protein [Burkholderia sp. TSV86]KVE33279.1 hypothetical protein WS68_12765 [Burkholderia sp. TSV86]